MDKLLSSFVRCSRKFIRGFIQTLSFSKSSFLFCLSSFACFAPVVQSSYTLDWAFLLTNDHNKWELSRERKRRALQHAQACQLFTQVSTTRFLKGTWKKIPLLLETKFRQIKPVCIFLVTRNNAVIVVILSTSKESLFSSWVSRKKKCIIFKSLWYIL